MSEYKGKTKADLEKTLSEKREALYSFRTGIAAGKVKNVKEGKNIRKDIARIHTEIHASARA